MLAGSGVTASLCARACEGVPPAACRASAACGEGAAASLGREFRSPRRPGGLPAQHRRRRSRASALHGDPGHRTTLHRPAGRGGATAVPSRSPGVSRSADLSCQPSGRRCCGVCPKASGLGVECCSVAGLCVQPGSLRLPGLVQGHLARDGCAPSLQHLRPSSLKTDLFAIPPLDSLSLSVLQPTSLIHHIWKGVLRTELNFLCIQWRHSFIPCFSTVWFKAAKANIWKESWRGLVGIWGLSRDPWGNHGKLSSLSSVASPA